MLRLDRSGLLEAEQSFVLLDYPSPQQLASVNGVRSTGVALAIDTCQLLWYPPQAVPDHLALFCAKS